MFALSYSTQGSPAVLTYQELADPLPGPGEVLVKNEAIAIEGGDVMLRQLYPPPGPDHVVGYSSAGEIVALGDGVTTLKLGQKVAVFGQAGSHASMRVARADETWTLPEGLDLESAACVAVAFGTAHEALFEHGQLKAGATVLLQGAAGGVCLAAMQLAKAAGARVIGTGSGHAQLDRLKPYGLDEGIDYHTEDLGARVDELTGGKGVDLAIDPVGGAMLDQVVAATGEGGRIVLIGGSSREKSAMDAVQLVLGNRTMSGFMLGKAFHTPRVHAMVAGLLDRMASGELKAVIDRRFPLSDGAAAHAYAESRGRVGRIILLP
jgi:NADPH2:quinone reductase